MEHIENFEIPGVAPAVRVLLPGIPPNVPISDRNNKNSSIGVSNLQIKRFSFWYPMPVWFGLGCLSVRSF